MNKKIIPLLFLLVFIPIYSVHATEITQTFTVNLTDNTNPTYSNVSLTGDCRTYKNITFSITANDGVGLSNLFIQKDSNVMGTFPYTFNKINTNGNRSYRYSIKYQNTVTQGRNSYVFFYVNDTSGNIVSSSTYCTVTATPPTAPVIISNLSQRENTYNPSITIQKGLDPDYGNTISTAIYIGDWTGTSCVNLTQDVNGTGTSYYLGLPNNGYNKTHHHQLLEGHNYCVIAKSFENLYPAGTVLFGNYSTPKTFRIKSTVLITGKSMTNPAYTNSTLTCSFNFYDPDKDILSARFVWSRNGTVYKNTSVFSTQPTNVNWVISNTFTCNRTACPKNQNITCSISNSKLSNSTSRLISNSRPSGMQIRTVPFAVAIDSQDLVSYCYADDVDNDNVRYYINYYKNNVFAGNSATGGYYPQGNEVLVYTLPNSETTLGEKWKFECRAFDGLEFSNFTMSNAITIAVAPSITSVDVKNERPREGSYTNGAGLNGALKGENIQINVNGLSANSDYIRMKACNNNVAGNWSQCTPLMCLSTLPTQFYPTETKTVSCLYKIPNTGVRLVNNFSVVAQNDYGLSTSLANLKYYVYVPPSFANQSLKLIDLLNGKQHWKYNFNLAPFDHLGILQCGVKINNEMPPLLYGTVGTNCSIDFTTDLTSTPKNYTPVVVTTGLVYHYLSTEKSYSIDKTISANNNKTSNMSVQWVYINTNLRAWTAGDFSNINWANDEISQKTISIIGGTTVTDSREGSINVIKSGNYYVIDNVSYYNYGTPNLIGFNYTVNWTLYNQYGSMPSFTIAYRPNNYALNTIAKINLNGAEIGSSSSYPMTFTLPEIKNNSAYKGNISHYGYLINETIPVTSFVTIDNIRHYTASYQVRFNYPQYIKNVGIVAFMPYSLLPHWESKFNATGLETVKEIYTMGGNLQGGVAWTENSGANRLENNWMASSGNDYYTVSLKWQYYDRIYACNDGIDNDGDGKIDTADTGCHTDHDATNGATYNPFGGSESWCGDLFKDPNEQCDGTMGLPTDGSTCTATCIVQGNGGTGGGGDTNTQINNGSRFVKLDPQRITVKVNRGELSVQEFKLRNVFQKSNTVKITQNALMSDSKTIGWISFRNSKNEKVDELNTILPEVTTVDSQIRFIQFYVDVPKTSTLDTYHLVYNIVDEDKFVQPLYIDVVVTQGIVETIGSLNEFNAVVISLVALSTMIGGLAIWLL